MNNGPVAPHQLDFLTGGGHMGALMRSHDWSDSPLGEPPTWPQSLRSVVGMLLGSQFPMFVAWGGSLGFLYNDAYAEILGDKHPDAIGRCFHDIWVEIWHDISPLVDAALSGEATYRQDLPLMMNRHGFVEQTWFTFSYSPVRDESGRVAGMFCACQETTGQVLAEQRLRSSEERYRSIVEGADDFAIVTLDEAGFVTGWNVGAQNLIGYTEAEAIGRSGEIFFTPEDRVSGAALNEMSRARSEGRAVNERWHLRNDRSRFWGSGLMMRLEAGGFVKMFRDRTAEHEASLSELKLWADIFETSKGLIAVLDSNDRFLAINKACSLEFESLFDIRPKAGDHLMELLCSHPESRAAVEAFWRRALSGEEFTVTEALGADHGPERRFYELTFHLLRDQAGRVIGAFQYGIDVTARIRGQAELEATQDALRQSQKMEAVGQLTGGIAHDFNNMLAVVIGSLDLLGRRIGDGDARARRYVDSATTSAKRAALLTQRLLAFSRQQPLQPETLDVNKLVANMSELIRGAIGSDVRLETVLASGV